jgi:hypothetical protein
MSDTSRMPVSVEFFPPKTPEGVAKLRAVRQQLYALKPEFCSVTFGAGGSTQEGTFNAVSEILAEGVSCCVAFLLHWRDTPDGARATGHTQGHGRQAPGGFAWRPAQRVWRGWRVPLRQ